MRKAIFLLVAVLVLSVGAFALADGTHKYVGVKKCAMCHKSEAKGNQHGKWLLTKHAKAFETLATPAALETAKKAGVAGNPQEAPQCLKCHTAGYGADSSLFGEAFVKADGVQCEACHGAGGDYMSMSVMKDKAAAIAAGMVIPTKEVCVKCHNSESPNFTGFDFEKFYPEIAHPMPK